MQRLAAARMALDIASPVLEQLITVELLAEAATIFPRQREGARRAATRWSRRCARTLPEWRFAVPAGGLSLWIELDAPRSTALAAVADRFGMRLAAGPRFGVDGAFERYLRVPYALPIPVLEDAVGRLAVAWRSVTESAPPSVQPRPRSSPEGTPPGTRALQGSMDFHALFDAQYVPVYRYLAHRLGDPAAAEDLAAETFLRAYAARASFRPGNRTRVAVHDRHQPAA